MDVIEGGIIVLLQPTSNSLVADSMIALHSLRESYFVFPLSTTIEERLLQP